MIVNRSKFGKIYKGIKKEMVEELIEPVPLLSEVEMRKDRYRGRLRKRKSNAFGESKFRNDFDDFYEKTVEKVNEGLDMMRLRE